MEPKGDQGHVLVTWFWHPRAPQDTKHVQEAPRHQKYILVVIFYYIFRSWDHFFGCFFCFLWSLDVFGILGGSRVPKPGRGDMPLVTFGLRFGSLF